MKGNNMEKINSVQLVSGIIKYLTTEIIPCVEDTFTKLALKTFAITANNRAGAYINAVDDLISKPFVADLLDVEGDVFEVESLIDAVRQAVNECGELTIKIPGVRFVSPQEKVLTFKASDISNLKQYLTNAISEV